MNAVKEASMDIKEGADILLIKPGIMYIDVLKEIKNTFKFPTFSLSSFWRVLYDKKCYYCRNI